MWCVRSFFTLMVSVRLGSNTTMSASLPGAMVPFLGNKPKVFAADVDVNSTKRLSEMRPSTTPVYMRAMRFSTPGAPFGIFVNESRPSSLPGRSGVGSPGFQVPLKQKGQWSVAIALK
jgi:hypothetical protein